MKQIVLTIFIVLAVNALYAQSSFGVKTGANFSKLKFSNKSYTINRIMGVNIGVFYNKDIENKMAVQPEINFSTEGNKWTTSTHTGRVYESQIRVPVLFQYLVYKGVYLEVGPQLGLLLSIKQSRNGGDKIDIKEYYKFAHFGYAFGAGYGFQGNLSRFKAGIRYNGDFFKINNKPVGGGELKNSLFQLSVFYNFKNFKGLK